MMREESGAIQRETGKPRFYRLKVDNAVRVTREEGITLGAKSNAFDMILREEVYTPKKLRRESKCLVKRHDNSHGEGNNSDFSGRENG